MYRDLTLRKRLPQINLKKHCDKPVPTGIEWVDTLMEKAYQNSMRGDRYVGIMRPFGRLTDRRHEMK